jgi:hypothetical protein
MGQELDCKIRLGRRSLTGKAQLETDYVLFRGEERLKLAFADLTSVKAADGILHLDYPGGRAEFELGKYAEKWADKILHPPTRTDKLGIKPGVTVALVGKFDAEFQSEMAPHLTAESPDITLYAAKTAADLRRLPKIAPKAALWIVYPKGQKTIREVEVIQAGRDAGLKDIKVARFSESHTALKFVHPRA